MRSHFALLAGLGIASLLAGAAVDTSAAAALRTTAVNQPRFYLTPSTSTVKVGSPLTVDVRLDTAGHPVNVAEIVLAYPTAVLALTSFDTSKSPLTAGFDPGAPTGAIDHVEYTPAGTAPVTGNILLGTLHFTGTRSGGSATLCTSDSSEAVDASTNTDIDATTATADVTVGTARTPRFGCLEANLLGQGAVQSLTLHGYGLTKGSPVTISGTGVSATAVSVGSTGALTSKLAVAVGATTGYRDVAVKVGSTTVTCRNCLRIEQGPLISGVSPSTVKRGRTTTVTISGSYIGPRSTVSVAGTGITVASVQWVNYSTIKAILKLTASASTGKHTVSLYDPTPRYGDGGRATCTACLTVTN